MENTSAGQSSVFVIDVKFRRNATWQGTIALAEKDGESRVVSFRSALEMIKIMDNVLIDRLPEE